MAALIERVRDEIVKDGAGLLRDAPRLGEDVVEHVISVHTMVVQRVFARVSKGGNVRCRETWGRTKGEDVRIREPKTPEELRDVRFDVQDVGHDES